MSLSEVCIRRPVMTTLLMLSFIVFGIFGYRQLPVSALPRVDFPTVSVSAQLPGASADTMASSVAGPLERCRQPLGVDVEAEDLRAFGGEAQHD